MARKGPNQKILTRGCFVKNSLFDLLFLVNLVFSLRIFCVCIEKVLCMALCSWKMGVWNGSQRMWDSFQTSHLMLKNLFFIVFGTLACMWRPLYVYTCIRPVYAAWGHAYFPKIDLFAHKKFIFSILIFLKSI